MIKSIQIQGFQSHEDSFLELNSHVNILVGSSDSGKTAILRALLWCIQNKPGGFSFCSHWGDSTKVQIEIDNHIITRFRNKNTNQYLLDNLKFNAIGTEVPKEIQDILNIKNVNINLQLDPPFLLSETPGAVASHFNRIAKLDKIDTGLQNINSWIRTLTTDIKYKMEQKESLTNELTQFEYLEKFEIDLEVLEEMEKKQIQWNKNYQQLASIIVKTKTIVVNIKAKSQLLSLEPLLDNIFKLKEQKLSLEKDWNKIDGLLDRIEYVRSEIETQQDLFSIEKPVLSLLELYEERKTLENERKGLFKALSSIRSTEIAIAKAKAKFEALYKEYDEVFPDKCPLCGLPIPRKK